MEIWCRLGSGLYLQSGFTSEGLTLVGFNSIILLFIITMNKASEGDGIPVEQFQILKDDAVKVLHSKIPANLENSAVTTGLEKVSFHSNPKESQCQRMLQLPHNCTHLTR